ncbi:MAG: N-acetyl-gamma-glutamyl-phosphate reductase [Deltaproteobacteria bacterium]|nr:N-acetyl-gamma-glutamyl-phosphate reductase [Deltaproteobacteria bacterium]
MKIRVGILGATGYTGAELARLLIPHPNVEIVWLTSEKFSGQKIYEVFPQFNKFIDIKCSSISKLKSFENVDLAFSCLPNGKSMHFVERLIQKGTRVIDISADFRFRDHGEYKNIYKVEHSCKDLLKSAVYGLPEIYKGKIKDATLVANPGCYSSSVIYGLAPVITDKLIEHGSIKIDSKAGLAGAGRAPVLEHQFSESNETALAFGVDKHDQKTEMEKQLSILSGGPVKLTFVPHRIPVNRGILTTIYSDLKRPVLIERLWELYLQFYKESYSIRICNLGKYPSLKSVRFTNFCDIGIGFQDDVYITVITLDNLGKGAAGQAIQNMNIMFGFPEQEGLTIPGMYP